MDSPSTPTPDVLPMPVAPMNPNIVRDVAVRHGRSARRAGFPKTPPPFVDPEMASHWRDGWRWEDEESDARRRPQSVGLKTRDER